MTIKANVPVIGHIHIGDNYCRSCFKEHIKPQYRKHAKDILPEHQTGKKGAYCCICGGCIHVNYRE